MKITPVHFEAIRAAVFIALDENRAAVEQHAVQFPPTTKRFRWDLLAIAKFEGATYSKWLCDNVYTYADDTHIDTALRALMPAVAVSLAGARWSTKGPCAVCGDHGDTSSAKFAGPYTCWECEQAAFALAVSNELP